MSLVGGGCNGVGIVGGGDDCCCCCCQCLDQICFYTLFALLYFIVFTFLILYILRYLGAISGNAANFGRTLTSDLIPNDNFVFINQNKTLDTYESIILKNLVKNLIN